MVVVQNSMVEDSNRCFNNLCGSHNQAFFFLNSAEVFGMTFSVKNQPHSGLKSPTRPLFYLFLARLSLGIWVQTNQIQKLQYGKLKYQVVHTQNDIKIAQNL